MQLFSFPSLAASSGALKIIVTHRTLHLFQLESTLEIKSLLVSRKKQQKWNGKKAPSSWKYIIYMLIDLHNGYWPKEKHRKKHPAAFIIKTRERSVAALNAWTRGAVIAINCPVNIGSGRAIPKISLHPLSEILVNAPEVDLRFYVSNKINCIPFDMQNRWSAPQTT